MSEARFDAAIIGGGLAGCSAAIRLAQQGYSTALFEAKTYPHHKVCGEFLSPECEILLAELDVMPLLRKHQPVYIHTVCISAPDGTVWEAPLPAPALSISRFALDASLAEHARNTGVVIYEGASVTQSQGSLDAGFSLDIRASSEQKQVQTRVVIGAYGKRSTLDRTLNRDFLRQNQPFVALKSHFYGAPLPGCIELHGFDGGYCGLSEVEGGKVNVCLLVRENIFQQAGSIPAFIDWMKRQNPRLNNWLSQARQIEDRWLSISQVPFVRKPAIEQDILMAGDSAGLIAPLAGSGMGMALQGGELAAIHAGKFLSGKSSASELRHNYAAEWNHAFGSRLRLSRFLQAFMLRPRLLSPGLRLINAVPALGHFFLNRTRDLTHIRQ